VDRRSRLLQRFWLAVNISPPNVSNQRLAWLSVSSGALRAQIDPLGAQLSVLRDGHERDLLWSGDPSVWSGRAPLLFPVVGALSGGAYRLGSNSYPLARHGFARTSAFQIVESNPNSAVLRLKADAASLQLYPFLFELDVHYVIHGATLSMTTIVRNLDDKSLPASFGYHPAFRWPLPFGQPRSSHAIEFASEEPAPVRRLDRNGLLTPEPHATPIVQRRLALADALFHDDVIIFDQLRSRYVTYGASNGPRIRVSFPDSPYLGIWTKPQAQFICIEPWHGVADPQGFSGDFTSKPGVFVVAAGAQMAIKMGIELLP
jgi:galactose mutarotase-like enzyme